MGNRRSGSRILGFLQRLGLARRDALLAYYPADLVEAYRRKEPGIVVALLKTLESPPSTLIHVRFTEIKAMPAEIGYEREDGDLFTLKTRSAMEYLDEMLILLARYARGEKKPDDLPEVGEFYKWRVLGRPRAMPRRDRLLGGTYEEYSKFLLPRNEGPKYHLRRELPHIRRTFKSKLGEAGIRLEGDPRIRAIDPYPDAELDGDGEERCALPSGGDLP